MTDHDQICSSLVKLAKLTKQDHAREKEKRVPCRRYTVHDLPNVALAHHPCNVVYRDEVQQLDMECNALTWGKREC